MIRTTPAFVLATLLAAPIAPAVHAQVTGLAPHRLTDHQIRGAIGDGRAFVDSLYRAHELPGLQVAVSVGGHVVWSEGIGYADLENKTAVTPLSRFRVGSVAKPITAVAVAQLAADGRLDLDAPVQDYVPSFPRKRWPITTRQLAGHLSGIRHYYCTKPALRPCDDVEPTLEAHLAAGNENFSAVRYETVSDGLAIFEDDPLLFEPGSEYSYSSYAWNLISAVIEGATGRPFLEYMQEHVFDELNLSHTAADRTDRLIPFRTRYYGYAPGGGLRNSPYVDNSYKWAGGGFLSTAEDLVRFADAHARPGFLSQASLDLLHTSQVLNDGTETGYGVGWRTYRDDEGRRIVGHGGGSVGGSTMLILYPETRVSVAITSNISRWPGDRSAFAQRIARPFLEALELVP
ncbi:MAG: beta-lactamase family protein [Gemmatimonadetes bacterium]|nr:beta-lactamase family protein [Gemmatimonadota bacterium]